MMMKNQINKFLIIKIMEDVNINRFKLLTDRMNSIYAAKNHDYGNSFEKSCDEYGITAALVRMEDKFNRLKSLKDKEPKVVDESIKDTLLDLANYCLMTRMWLNEKTYEHKSLKP